MGNTPHTHRVTLLSKRPLPRVISPILGRRLCCCRRSRRSHRRRRRELNKHSFGIRGKKHIGTPDYIHLIIIIIIIIPCAEYK